MELSALQRGMMRWRRSLQVLAWIALVLMAGASVAQLCGLVPFVWEGPWARQMTYAPLLLVFPLVMLLLVVYRRRWYVVLAAAAFLVAMPFLVLIGRHPSLYLLAVVQLVPMVFVLAMRIPYSIGRLSAFVAITTLPLFALSYVAHTMDDYFTPALDISQEKLHERTANGHPYTHDVQRREYESGLRVWVNVCDEELERAWVHAVGHRDTTVPWVGSAERVALVHYLTSKGFRKDSVGVSLLEPHEIAAIAGGTHHWRLVGHGAPYRYLWRELEGIDRYRSGDTTHMTDLVRGFCAVRSVWPSLRWWPWSQRSVFDEELMSGEGMMPSVGTLLRKLEDNPTPVGFVNLAAQMGLATTVLIYAVLWFVALVVTIRRANGSYVACAWWVTWVMWGTASGANQDAWLLAVALCVVLCWQRGDLYHFWDIRSARTMS